jgi:hypothetical protein
MLWNAFLMGRPDLAGSRHDDPDPENEVWPDFLEWRAQVASAIASEKEGADEILPVTRRLLRGGVE